MNPLAPRARLLFHLQAVSQLVFLWIPTTIVAVMAAAWLTSFVTALAAGSLLLLACLLGTVWLPSLAYERWGWELRENELLVQHGVVFRSVTAIPIGRVQHVDVRQGPIEQWMGLARVHVHTASGVGADGMIPGLERAVAEKLRDQLVARSRAQPDRTADLPERDDDGV